MKTPDEPASFGVFFTAQRTPRRLTAGREAVRPLRVAAPSPSGRSLTGIALLLLSIVLLALVVAAMSPMVGGWPVLVQALFYVGMVIFWTMSLKTLIRWMVTGQFRAPSRMPRD